MSPAEGSRPRPSDGETSSSAWSISFLTTASPLSPIAGPPPFHSPKAPSPPSPRLRDRRRFARHPRARQHGSEPEIAHAPHFDADTENRPYDASAVQWVADSARRCQAAALTEWASSLPRPPSTRGDHVGRLRPLHDNVHRLGSRTTTTGPMSCPTQRYDGRYSSQWGSCSATPPASVFLRLRLTRRPGDFAEADLRLWTEGCVPLRRALTKLPWDARDDLR